MHQEVYIDIVFAANLLMDYILLRLTGIVLRRKNSRRRCLAAAAVGALFACLNLYVRPGKTGVLTIVLRVVCAVFMIWIAYEIQDVKHMTGAALFFFGMTFLTGGFWMAVSENRRVTAVFFLSCAAVTYGGLSLMICLMEQIKESREHIYPVALARRAMEVTGHENDDFKKLPIRENLLARMREAGVDLPVNLPVVSKPQNYFEVF